MFYNFFLLSFSFSLIGNSELYSLKRRNGYLHADDYATSIVKSHMIKSLPESKYPIYLNSQRKEWTARKTYEEVKQNPQTAHGNPLLLEKYPFLYRKQTPDFKRRPYPMNYDYWIRNNVNFKDDLETSQELLENQNMINDDDNGNGSGSQEQRNQIVTNKEKDISLQRPPPLAQKAIVIQSQIVNAFCTLCCQFQSNTELRSDCILQFCVDSIPNCD